MFFSKRFLPAVVLLFSFAFLMIASARAEDAVPADQNAPEEPFEKAVTVATVNVQDVQLVKQEGNAITLAFNISNREGVQPRIVYAISLFRTDDKGVRQLMERKVYSDDMLNLGINDSRHKEIDFVAPGYLSGSFEAEIEARNPDGLLFGTAALSTPVVLDGKDGFLRVGPSDCFLTVNGESSDKKYTVFEGVDIASNESLTAHCHVVSAFPNDQTFVPTFQTYIRSEFGSRVDEKKAASIMLKPGDESDFSTIFPVPSLPQSYDTVLSFTDKNGSRVSSPIVFRFVVRGESATIKNITLDKSSYVKGDAAQAMFFWMGSGDGTLAPRMGNDDFDSDLTATFVLNDGQGVSCADPLNKALDPAKKLDAETVTIPVTRDCSDPVVSVSIANKDGKTLAGDAYGMSSASKAYSEASSEAGRFPRTTLRVLSAATAALLLVVALVLFSFKKRSRRSGMAVIVGLIIGAAGMFSGVDGARADTFVVAFPQPVGQPNGFGAWCEFTANLDRSVYWVGAGVSPSDRIAISGSSVCSANMLNPQLTAISTANGASKQNIFNTTALFQIPSAGGSYAAQITGSGVNGSNPASGRKYKTISLPYTVVENTAPSAPSITEVAPAPYNAQHAPNNHIAGDTQYFYLTSVDTNTPPNYPSPQKLTYCVRVIQYPWYNDPNGYQTHMITPPNPTQCFPPIDQGMPQEFSYRWNMSNDVLPYNVSLLAQSTDSYGIASAWSPVYSFTMNKRPTSPSSPAPTITFSASPASIQSGQSSTLTWSSNAASCSATGGWSASTSPNGSQSVSPSATTTYTLTCVSSTGVSASKSVSVTVTAGPAPVSCALPKCTCDPARAATVCSGQTYRASGSGCDTRDDCAGTKTCTAGGWEEVAPIN